MARTHPRAPAGRGQDSVPWLERHRAVVLGLTATLGRREVLQRLRAMGYPGTKSGFFGWQAQQPEAAEQRHQKLSAAGREGRRLTPPGPKPRRAGPQLITFPSRPDPLAQRPRLHRRLAQFSAAELAALVAKIQARQARI